MDYIIPYKINNAMNLCINESDTFGIADDAVLFLTQNHFCNKDLWKKFVDQYRIREDGTNGGWRGEYWGKMMRGAVMLYQHSKSEKLFDVLTESVKDMLTVGSDGRVSSYTVDKEFTNWDMWGRKYVLLGLEYYLEICNDEELCLRIVAFLRLVADYIIDHIGEGDGQLKITDSSKHWNALNSCSILEPMTRLYRFTGDEKYLAFSKYIVETGGAKGINVFKLAYENKIAPYQYGTPKAYELMSCFEGLIEYALIVGDEYYKSAAINFAKKIIETDVTVIGCCGVTHELLDHSKARQTSFYEDVSQETCVTVTWMKFCARLLRLTGEAVFAKELERSFYNAFLGSLNIENRYCDYAHTLAHKQGRTDLVDVLLPFDSYSPLIPGKRGRKMGGFQILSDGSYYGCCACIGGAGIGAYLQSVITQSDKFVAINFMFNGKQYFKRGDANITVEMNTEYPLFGKCNVKICSDKQADFELRIRIPEGAQNVNVICEYTSKIESEYIVIDDDWSKQKDIGISFDLPVTPHFPEEWKEDELFGAVFYSGKSERGKIYQDPKDLDFICLTRGPIVLAADSSLGKPADSVFDIDTSRLDRTKILSPKENSSHLILAEIEDTNGNTITLADYGSCGRNWETVISAWLPTK